MSDTYSTIFSEDPRTGALTAAQLDARRRIVAALATRNRPYPKTIGEGLTALGEGLGEGYANDRIGRAEAAQIAGDRAALLPPSGAVPPPAPSVAPAVPRAPPGRVSEAPADNILASYTGAASEDGQPVKLASLSPSPVTTDEASQPPGMTNEEWKARIRRNESGGQRDPYRAVGELSRRGDRAYGAYQVMGENIPKWTKQYVGREMTPQEFLQDDKAQDIVADGQGGKYRAKYGDDGAARAWFAGEKGMNDPNRRDTLGTHVAEYSRRFNIPLVTRDQVVASAAKNPNAFASAPQMPPEAANAMAYAPEGGGDAADMLSTLTNPQPPGLGLRGPSDSTFPAPAAAPAVSRDSIAASVAAQNGIVPPQQVAAGPAPLPQAPPALPQPQAAPRVPAFPAYGDEPKPPPPTADMIHYRRVAADPYRGEQARATALDLYNKMEAAQKEEFARKYQLWHENKQKERDYTISLPKAQEDLTGTYLENLKRPQGIITGQGSAPQAAPQPQQDNYDPRLGSSQSPQRSRIPAPETKPAGVSQEEWSKLQAPQMSKAIEAVDKAVPAFDDAIRTIQLARQHPGREWGVGPTASLATKIPGTDAFGFSKIMEQIGGKNFLAAYGQLKGGGAITEIEGTKAESSQARLSTSQNKKDWAAAMDDLERTLRRDMELAQRKVNAPVTAWRKPGDNASYAPDIGERRGNKEYIGGNPADPMSWRRMQ